jgi:hypothetical protein
VLRRASFRPALFVLLFSSCSSSKEPKKLPKKSFFEKSFFTFFTQNKKE